jgi:hypothetical protein
MSPSFFINNGYYYTKSETDYSSFSFGLLAHLFIYRCLVLFTVKRTWWCLEFSSLTIVFQIGKRPWGIQLSCTQINWKAYSTFILVLGNIKNINLRHSLGPGGWLSSIHRKYSASDSVTRIRVSAYHRLTDPLCRSRAIQSTVCPLKQTSSEGQCAKLVSKWTKGAVSGKAVRVGAWSSWIPPWWFEIGCQYRAHISLVVRAIQNITIRWEERGFFAGKLDGLFVRGRSWSST